MRPRPFGFFFTRSQKKVYRPAASVRPRLEALEDRLTPTLTYHGGAVLASVQAQAVYLGAGWGASTIPTSVFDAFLNTAVANTPTGQAPYLAMLHKAGFAGVTGNGSALAGVPDNVSVPSTITDAQIQTDLQAVISSSALVQQPNANTLYEVFVQPNVVVDIGNGETSVNTFLAYHSSFAGVNALNQSAEVRYAVIPFHGTAGNAQDPWLNQQDSMTVAASHETAEAVTDPDGTAYFDRSGNEVGDVVNGSTVYLPGSGGAKYAVQREGSLPASLFNFLPMTPTGATASLADSFGGMGGPQLTVNGAPVANPSGEPATVTVKSVSAPGIDDFGQPMVDVVFSDGHAYEFHDFAQVNGQPNPTKAANPSFFPWTNLGGNVKQAVAGQAVSYVLLTNGALGEYVDANYSTYSYGYGVNPGARFGAIATGVTSITAATLDSLGVNAVVYTKTVSGKTTTYEWHDVTASAVPLSSSGSSPSSGNAPSKGNPSSNGNSELPTTLGGGGTSGASSLTGADLLLLSTPPAAPVVFTAPQEQAAAPTSSPAALPTPLETVHIAFPDGGGGSSRDLAKGPASPSDGTAPPAGIGDVPLLGAAFTEAVRRLKAMPFTLPPGFWPAAPMDHNAPPAPPKGQPPAVPQGKATHAIPWDELALYALPVAVGLCGVGIEREERRRREGLSGKPR